MNELAINVKQVSRSFGKVQALDKVSFTVEPQSIFGLLGPNGAGKTTLFSIAANFIHADSGSIDVLGIDVKYISKLKGRLTILPQDALFQRNVPILEQLVFFRLLDGKNRREAEEEVKRTLQMVGLGEYMNRRVHALSHGMVNRLGVAQAFLGDPEVILLDEPTSGLDPKNARQIRDLIRELQTRATLVISSHNLAEIQELCDHVAILDEGKLIVAGSVAEITSTGKTIDIRLSRLLTPEEMEKITALEGVETIKPVPPDRYTLSLNLTEIGDAAIEGNGADIVLSAVLRMLLDLGITPREFREGATLEEHFLKVTGKGED